MTCTDIKGNTYCGQFVSRKIQLRHHLADIQDSSSRISSREASPEPKTTANDQEVEEDKLDLAFEKLQLEDVDPSLTGE